MSFRSSAGSVGTKGFSLRSGIPGLSYRANWGKGGGVLTAFIFAITYGTFMLLWNLGCWLLFYVIPGILQLVSWVALTSYDYILYVVQKVRRLSVKQ